MTSISNATLIKSAGLFLLAAAVRIASAATVRARFGSCVTPEWDRTSSRWALAVRTPATGRVTSGRSRQRRMWSTTDDGTSSPDGKYPRRWKHLSVTASARRCWSERVRSLAHAISASLGVSVASSRAVTSRRNRGYAVLSTDAIASTPVPRATVAAVYQRRPTPGLPDNGGFSGSDEPFALSSLYPY